MPQYPADKFQAARRVQIAVGHPRKGLCENLAARVARLNVASTLSLSPHHVFTAL
jgi:hypothetical protein